MNQSEQAWKDLDNPAFQQREEIYFTDAERDNFYAPRPPVQRDDNAGISPSKIAVAQALVSPIMRGHVDRNGSEQEKADAIYYIARHEGIKFAGVPEEWLTPGYVADVFEMAIALIERSAA